MHVHVHIHTYCTYTHTVLPHILYLHTYCTYTHTVLTHMLYLHTYCTYTHTVLNTYCTYTHTVLTHILYLHTYCTGQRATLDELITIVDSLGCQEAVDVLRREKGVLLVCDHAKKRRRKKGICVHVTVKTEYTQTICCLLFSKTPLFWDVKIANRHPKREK